METMERDAKYIAQQLKFLRKTRRLKQQNVADMTGLTTRTIEKAESGRHVPAEQSLRAIARAFGLDGLAFFEKPTKEQLHQLKTEIDRAERKTVFVPLSVVRNEHDAISMMTGPHMYNFDISPVEGEAAIRLAASVVDWIKDNGDAWDELSMTERVDAAQQCLGYCSELEQLGYICHVGFYRQQLRQPENKPWVVRVTLVIFLPKAQSDSTRVAMVTLPGGWETLPNTRSELP